MTGHVTFVLEVFYAADISAHVLGWLQLRHGRRRLWFSKGTSLGMVAVGMLKPLKRSVLLLFEYMLTWP